MRGYRLYCDIRSFDGAADRLYRNDGNGSFTDVSRTAGIANPAGKGLGLVFGDFDADGHIDLYVANDTVRDFLYENRGNGTFRDVTFDAGVGYDPGGNPQAGMGVDAADLNGDGLLEIFVTNFAYENNFLFRNRGNLQFENVSGDGDLSSGLLPLGFGARLFDFDNDGDSDIYVANGHIEDRIHLYFPQLSHAQRDLLYENRDGQFRDVSRKAGSAFRLENVGRGAAVADYDNDGDLDIVVSNSGGTPTLMRNEGGNRNHWLAILAKGTRSNSHGFGTRVRVQTGSRSQLKEINNVSSYLSSSDLRLYFGLGRQTQAERITLTWPGGVKQELRNIAADQVLSIQEPQ